MQQLSFYDALLPAVLSGKKTISIRSRKGLLYEPGTVVELCSHSTGQCFGTLIITAVEPLHYQQINETHAQLEQMSLVALRLLIKKIYPDTEHLSVISFKLIQ